MQPAPILPYPRSLPPPPFSVYLSLSLSLSSHAPSSPSPPKSPTGHHPAGGNDSSMFPSTPSSQVRRIMPGWREPVAAAPVAVRWHRVRASAPDSEPPTRSGTRGAVALARASQTLRGASAITRAWGAGTSVTTGPGREGPRSPYRQGSRPGIIIRVNGPPP